MKAILVTLNDDMTDEQVQALCGALPFVIKGIVSAAVYSQDNQADARKAAYINLLRSIFGDDFVKKMIESGKLEV